MALAAFSATGRSRATSCKGSSIAFFEDGESASKFATYLGKDLIEVEPYDNPSAGNGMGHSGTFVRFRTENHPIDEVIAFVAMLD